MAVGRRQSVVVIGAGIGGIAAALRLATEGFDVTVLEAAAHPGGKAREVMVGGRPIEAGPTVFTMRCVFDALLAPAERRLDDLVRLTPLSVLARHAWSADERLDLHADREASADAIARFAGPTEGRNYLAFCRQAGRTYEALKDTFMAAERPSMVEFVRRAGWRGLGAMLAANPFDTLWQALGKSFADQRLRQLFGRYATYCGSSPFEAPATLMLVAHVEQEGVWAVEGGMHRLASALAAAAGAAGARFRYGAPVAEILLRGGAAAGVRLASGETVEADAVICNADTNAIATGLFGTAAAAAVPPTARDERALSAVTLAMTARASGFPLTRHNVFFSGDYAAEFDAIRRDGRLPADPTVYVCAQDRDGGRSAPDEERLLVLVNAPPRGDATPFTPAEIDSCLTATSTRLARCGLTLSPSASLTTQPSDWERLFPATGGALYGRTTHGATASFQRPGSRSRIPGLYLAGGSVHPGPGVPMVALSGMLAAQALMADRASTSPSVRAAMRGGISMR